MTTVSKSVQAFTNSWKAARKEESQQGNKVSYAEIKTAIATLTADQHLSRYEAAQAASTIANDPVLTGPASKEVYAFLKTVGQGHGFDQATVEAVKAEFALRATGPFQAFEVPGRPVKNTIDLPDSVQKAVAQTAEKDGSGTWGTIGVRKATLAGQSVLVVHYADFDSNGDAEKVRLFSPAGREFADGALWDAMGGFGWE